MDPERLGDQRAHGPARAERGDRVLEHHRDRAPPGLQRPLGEAQELGALEADRARLRRHKADDGAAERGLARAALADQREGVAGRDGEGDAGDRLEPEVGARPGARRRAGPGAGSGPGGPRPRAATLSSRPADGSGRDGRRRPRTSRARSGGSGRAPWRSAARRRSPAAARIRSGHLARDGRQRRGRSACSAAGSQASSAWV